jgi:acetolactate synthase-1/2/3 large subunit
LFEAAFASSPVLMLTGQIDTPYLGKGKGFLHEAEPASRMLRTVTRRDGTPRRCDYRRHRAGRARRVDVCRNPAREIPVDFQYQQLANGAAPATPARSLKPTQAALVDAARLIRKRRDAYMGRRRRHQRQCGRRAPTVADLDAPVLTSGNGRGSLPEDHALAMGPLTVQPDRTLAAAELIIAVGTRFRVARRKLEFAAAGKLLHIDADPGVVGRNYPADVAVIGDARSALTALLAALNAEPGDVDFLRDAQQARDTARAAIRVQMGPDHQRIMDTIRRKLPRLGVIVRDATVPAYIWGNRLLPILTPRTSLSTTSAAIGPGLPLAIGAAVATQQKTVVIQGDGGFMLHIGELATAAQYQLPIVICVFNDGGYGVLRAIHQMRFDGRNTGVDIKTPDFVTVATGMGVFAEHVASAAAFEAAFDRAMERSGPTLLDIDMNALAPMGDLFGRPRRT